VNVAFKKGVPSPIAALLTPQINGQAVAIGGGGNIARSRSRTSHHSGLAEAGRGGHAGGAETQRLHGFFGWHKKRQELDWLQYQCNLVNDTNRSTGRIAFYGQLCCEEVGVCAGDENFVQLSFASLIYSSVGNS
jgi:hypothetical protein